MLGQPALQPLVLNIFFPLLPNFDQTFVFMTLFS